jgi:hypothetical protein
MRGLAPIVRELTGRAGRHAFVEVPGATPSYAVVRIVERRTGKLELEGDSFEYEVLVHDGTAVPDLETYRATKSGRGPARVSRVAVIAGRRIHLDRAAIEQIGREQFLPRIDAYRELARVAQDDAPFLAAASAPSSILDLTKDVLRWRSLATVVEKEEPLRAFREAYERREEARAAIEARELERAAEGPPPSRERLVAAEKRARLLAIVHGDAAGEVANALGLARVALEWKEGAATLPPTLAASASVVAGLVRSFAAETEARSFARLARAGEDELRAAARALVAE